MRAELVTYFLLRKPMLNQEEILIGESIEFIRSDLSNETWHISYNYWSFYVNKALYNMVNNRELEIK